MLNKKNVVSLSMVRTPELIWPDIRRLNRIRYAIRPYQENKIVTFKNVSSSEGFKHDISLLPIYKKL
jgi:hypothetical protein